jgi:hypothetical protein
MERSERKRKGGGREEARIGRGETYAVSSQVVLVVLLVLDEEAVGVRGGWKIGDLNEEDSADKRAQLVREKMKAKAREGRRLTPSPMKKRVGLEGRAA